MSENHEIGCRSILNPSRIPGIDYTVNPYAGCLHGCVYCYARFMKFNRGREQSWGAVCDVKINAAAIFRKQIVRARPGRISLSTATDPYQPAEKKYRITRQILETLIPLPFHVSVLTKSDGVVRDIDILRKFPKGHCEVGLSFSTADPETAGIFEPGAPSPRRRVDAIRLLHAAGIQTWIFLAPLLPEFSLLNFESFLKQIQGSVDYIRVDPLNIKGLSSRMGAVIRSRYPEREGHWRQLLTVPDAYDHMIRGTLNPVMEMITDAGIPVSVCE